MRAQVVPDTHSETPQGFVTVRTAEAANVYTDEAAAYKGLRGRYDEAVKHSVGEYVRDMAHTNGMESFRSLLKRGHDGTLHHMSEKHFDRYVSEFAGRRNIRNADTVDQMAITARQNAGECLRQRDLVV